MTDFLNAETHSEFFNNPEDLRKEAKRQIKKLKVRTVKLKVEDSLTNSNLMTWLP